MKTIYLAGGCFWGLEEYFKRKEYTVDTTVGYANSNVENPDYKKVCTGMTGASETLKLSYNGDLETVLKDFFKVINPTVLNRQGNDHGTQYRTGIYYQNDEDKNIILDFISDIKGNYEKEIVTEIMELKNFYDAEEYHQDYLTKNPGGYCHINLDQM